MAGQDWFGVRCWFLFDAGSVVEERGQHYEERVTLWRASSPDDARERAIAEGDQYASESGATRLDYVDTYRMYDGPGEGAEVWSVMRDSWLAPDEYLARFATEGIPPGTDT